MFLDHDLKPTDPKLPIRSKYAPKRNRSHPDDPAYARTDTDKGNEGYRAFAKLCIRPELRKGLPDNYDSWSSEGG